MLISIVILLGLLSVLVYLFLQQAQFGKPPSGARLQKVQQSPNFKNGAFQNQHHTPALTEGAGYLGVMREFFFGKSKRSNPSDSLPSKKVDLLHLDPSSNVLVWFGHSSYFMQVEGKKILVDPVLSGSASPLKFTTRSFRGSDVYTADEIPDIDYLFITHDHWDHLDYETLLQLKPRVGKIITGLGVGAHLEYWGFDTSKIEERDWNEKVILEEGFVVYTAPARHFSGRGFKRNGSLWMSFVLITPKKKIYIGGDSGYDTHFAEIGKKYGPFDLAILENGQYDKSWKYIHMMPEETVQAAIDLRAARLMPVHWSKFSLALHAWDEPVLRIFKSAAEKKLPLLHPLIGEAVNLDSIGSYPTWWSNIQ